MSSETCSVTSCGGDGPSRRRESYVCLARPVGRGGLEETGVDRPSSRGTTPVPRSRQGVLALVDVRVPRDVVVPDARSCGSRLADDVGCPRLVDDVGCPRLANPTDHPSFPAFRRNDQKEREQSPRSLILRASPPGRHSSLVPAGFDTIRLQARS
jgi:hypothetical protein